MPSAAAHPDVETLMRLGAAREIAGDHAGACDAFRRAAQQAPGEPAPRLFLGQALERLGRDDEAVAAYYRAIIEAQRQGRWLNRATTAQALHDQVRHAMRVVKQGRRRAFDRALAGVFARHAHADLERVRDCVAISAGERHAAPADPRQQPTMLYFPDLPTAPYFERSLFSWIGDLESQVAVIREELLAVLSESGQRERVFADDSEERSGLAAASGIPGWEGLYFYRHGERRDKNHRICPRTSAALEALPLMRIRDQAPEVMFSVLTPGTHILPHRGVTNTRVVCHLPLIVPEACALVVGGTAHHWREGEVVVFDDTFEHEAWNRGSRTRVVLIFDVWNPHLSETECEAMATLVDAIDDFNQAAAA